MPNFFDQFDAPTGPLQITVRPQDANPPQTNYFDQFDPATMTGGDIAVDVVKSGGVGLAKGGIGLAGLPGDARGLVGSITDWAAGKLGASPESIARVRQLMEANKMAPTSQDIQKKIEGYTGEFYKPKTTAGEFAQTAGELAPMLAGPGGVIRKGVQLAGATFGSEGAGRLAREIAPGAEPYARVLGAVAGGAPFMGRGASNVATRQEAINKTLQAAEQGYKSPEVGTLIFKPQAIDTLSTAISSQLRRAKANERLAPQTNAIVSELKQPVNGTWHSYEDLQTTRELLQKQASGAGMHSSPQEQRAATIALKSLTSYIDNIPQSHLVLGNAKAASETLTAARGNYAAGKTAERVAEKLKNAELQAGSTYSGGNINNATRQKLRPLLTSKKGQRGLTEDELAQIESAVVGSPTGNALRATGKLLGGAGGQQALTSMGLGGGMGAFLGGHPGALVGAVLPPAIGYVARKAGDALTRRHSDKIVEQILSRSPLGLSANSPLNTLVSAPPWLQQVILSSLLMRPQIQSPQQRPEYAQ